MARRVHLSTLFLGTAGLLLSGLASTLGSTSVDGGSAAVIAAGNIGDCSSDGDEATAAIVAELDGVVATLGDTAYPNGSEASFEDCYDPTWGRFADRTRPVPGNHDYEAGDADAYFSYFGDAAGNPERGYYSYSVGSWHVVALNSVCGEVDCGPASDQLAWLRADLQAAAADCLLAYWHHPRFTSGGVGSDTRMAPAWQMLQEAGAEVVLSGHSHLYERFAPMDEHGTERPDGIRQFVVGTGGTHLHAVGSQLLSSEAVIGERHGVLHLELGAASYRWRFLAVGEASPLDEGVGECQARPIQLSSVVRSLAPVLVIVPLVSVMIVVLLGRFPHFRIN